MKKIILLILFLMFLFVGCANNADEYVSKEEYNKLSSEVESLKEQLATDSIENITETDSSLSQQKPLEKVLLDEINFELDENNYLYFAFYQKGEEYYATGYGILEEENANIVSKHGNICYWMCTCPALFCKDVDVTYSVGDHDYSFKFSDGEEIANTLLDESYRIPDNYQEKINELFDAFDVLYTENIWEK